MATGIGVALSGQEKVNSRDSDYVVAAARSLRASHLMLIVDAVLVMRQCIDDAAVGDRALGAMFDHT